jgi:hypothetical protein
MNTQAIQWIRKYYKKTSIDFSEHARDQMRIRKIEMSEIFGAIEKGTPIETQDLEGNVKILFQENTEGIPRFGVVVASSMPPRIVTVYWFKKDKWEYDKSIGQMRRRK